MRYLARDIGDHDNVARVVGVHVLTPLVTFVVSEVYSQTLGAFCGQDVADEHARIITTQIARALDFAHQSGHVHGALAPDVIYIDDRLRVKVGDFGLDHPNALPYRAPEVCMERYPPCSPCDVWSLACLVVHIWDPYQREPIEALIDCEPPALEFATVLMRYDPRKRPSMRDVLSLPLISKYAELTVQ